MAARQTIVKVGQVAVGGEDDVLVTLGLGSCVAIVLHDPAARVGGMAHILLPSPANGRDGSNLAKFATTAVPLLIAEIERIGGSAACLGARLAGGASMFASLMVPGSPGMGERNLEAVRATLRSAGIVIAAEAVGGDYGRSVRFRTGGGQVIVSSVYRDDVIL